MEVIKQSNGKYLRANNGGYLTQSNVADDLQKVLVYQVYIPSSELVDQWIEIDQEEGERIRKAKQQATGSVDYPEQEVNQALDFMSTVINTISLTDTQALQFKNLYPKWESFIGAQLKQGYKVLYDDKLYKVLQDISVVSEDQYPSINTAALYTEVTPSVEEGGSAGTYQDPIQYNNNMELEYGKFYIQNGVIYECIRNTEIPVYADLSALIDNYVKVATNN